MKTPTGHAASTQKVRRDTTGGKRGNGHELQGVRRRVRPDPGKIAMGKPDAAVTGLAGLIGFGTWARKAGVDAALRKSFGHLKTHRMVVYPMEAQLRLLMDATLVGESRVFGLENLASDPLFTFLAGGVVPSIDVLYDDLARMGESELQALESMVAEHGLAGLREMRPEEIHVDIDTTVECLFGRQEGARPGSNPRYHGRPSYHPILARIADTGRIVGAKLRPGDTSFGAADVPTLVAWIQRIREAVGPRCQITVRIDAAGDCSELFEALGALPNVIYIVKADMTQNLCAAIARQATWTTVEPLVGERPMLQVAEINFVRGVWNERRVYPRVVAVRSRERDNGKQIFLWDDLDWTVQAYVTNHHVIPIDEVRHDYNLRAGIEPLIGDLKGGMGIGKVPTQSFNANHAMFLLKVLTYNLQHRYVRECFPSIAAWRTPWIRRALFLIPGRVCKSGRRRTLRVHPRSLLVRDLN